MQFSLDTVRAVTRLLHESDLAEISLETTDNDTASSRLTVRRQAPARALRRQPVAEPNDSVVTSMVNGSSAALGVDADSPGTLEANGAAVEADETITVSATAVGMFRCSQPPVRVGDTVKIGQVVGIVESLKIPNEVVAPVAGTITEVLAEEGQAVEYGQPLLAISPSQ